MLVAVQDRGHKTQMTANKRGQKGDLPHSPVFARILYPGL